MLCQCQLGVQSRHFLLWVMDLFNWSANETKNPSLTGTENGTQSYMSNELERLHAGASACWSWYDTLLLRYLMKVVFSERASDGAQRDILEWTSLICSNFISLQSADCRGYIVLQEDISPNWVYGEPFLPCLYQRILRTTQVKPE